MSEKETIDIEELLAKSRKDIAVVLKSLGHHLRLEIVRSLWNEEQAFIDLKTATGLSKTALVHHLEGLVETGLIERLERGLYELTADGREIITACVTGYSKLQIRKKHESAQRAAYIQRVHAKKSDTIDDIEVRIERLTPMRVASVKAISRTPENDAWQKMRAWAEPLGLLNNPRKHLVYGFNNPNPQSGKSEYGYEFWMVIDKDYELVEGMEYKDFEGGLYAVKTCNLTEEIESEFFKEHGALESWKKLIEWTRASKYTAVKAHCLELAHDPVGTDGDSILDLYQPIKEK